LEVGEQLKRQAPEFVDNISSQYINNMLAGCKICHPPRMPGILPEEYYTLESLKNLR
jgi:hypothetical protein